MRGRKMGGGSLATARREDRGERDEELHRLYRIRDEETVPFIERSRTVVLGIHKKTDSSCRLRNLCGYCHGFGQEELAVTLTTMFEVDCEAGQPYRWKAVLRRVLFPQLFRHVVDVHRTGRYRNEPVDGVGFAVG